MLKYLIAFTTFFSYLSSERNFHVQLTKVDCINAVPGFFKNITCVLSEHHNVSYLNIWMELPKPITTMSVRYILEASMPKRSKLKLLDIKQEGCDFFRLSPKQEVIKTAQKYLMKYINRRPVCPLDANFTYIIKDFNVDIEDMPSFTPELEFSLTIFVLEMNKITFKFLGEGKVIHNINFSRMSKVQKKNFSVIGNLSGIAKKIL